MKRGPKQGDKADTTRTRVKKWQARFLAALAKAPSVSHAAKAAGVHRSTCYAVRDSDPQFAEAWQQALEMSVDNLVVAAFQRALKSSDTLLTFLLRAHRPQLYNFSQGENVGEKPDEKKISLNVYYNNDQPLSQLLDFPIHSSMGQGYDSAKVAREKQRRLTGESDATGKAPARNNLRRTSGRRKNLGRASAQSEQSFNGKASKTSIHSSIASNSKKCLSSLSE